MILIIFLFIGHLSLCCFLSIPTFIMLVKFDGSFYDRVIPVIPRSSHYGLNNISNIMKYFYN